ncbi:MAG TPA: cation-translocating P-type ATPase [Thermoanaerobaculia bacterium]|nr:cation-translocating P-type ATPase [Thermoanaerobaculia bacterium]
MEAQLWHGLSAEEALDRLGSTKQGLSSDEAARRLERYGPNELRAADRVSAFQLLLAQLKNALILILIAATVLSAFLGHLVEAITILVIVLFAVVLGFIQEYRAERAIEALQRMAAPNATVLRDGEEVKIPARDLVPGDLVLIAAGDRCPADARLVTAVNLQIEEAVLTGESMPVEKVSTTLAATELPLGDRKNLVFAGTAATYGRGSGAVTATGMSTEFGRIAGMLATIETGRTSLQDALDRVGHVLARAAIVLILLIVGIGIFRGQPLLEMILFGIALAVAVVPEALPAVVTISLALGVQRMVKRNALVRRLPAVEGLGSVSVICSDKTGTLTRDEMTVRSIFVAGKTITVTGAGYEPTGTFSTEQGEPLAHGGEGQGGLAEMLEALLEAATLASDARLRPPAAEGDGKDLRGWRLHGDPTEGALVVVAAKLGVDRAALEARYPRTAETPFTAESRRMTTLHDAPGGGSLAFAKGAPEVILAASSHQLTRDGERPLEEADRRAVLESALAMARQALRVLAVARKSDTTLAAAEDGLTFLGLVGMFDPPRAEAAPAIRVCERAGILALMITGDHPATAEAVARELGILDGGRVVTGIELDEMEDEALERQVGEIKVYARVSPAHKLRVVSAWQRRGHYVAMTGDGVNDAPALKKADIGVAMGLTGTDVSREAAAMTLTDDNFASIVAAIEEGRRVFGNVKKYLMYLLSCNIGEIGLMVVASFAGLPLPLTTVQILYVNLATDGLPALALAVDPPDADLMSRPPRGRRSGLFSRPVVTLMLLGGVWATVVNSGLFAWVLAAGASEAKARTMVFTSIVLTEFFKAYSFRSERLSVAVRPFANKWLNLAIGWELVLLGFILYFPPMERVFGTLAMSQRELAVVAGVAATIVPVLEIGKWFLRRAERRREPAAGSAAPA